MEAGRRGARRIGRFSGSRSGAALMRSTYLSSRCFSRGGVSEISAKGYRILNSV